MRKVSLIIALFFLIFTFSGCKKVNSGEVNRYWKGYLSNGKGSKDEVVINFTGREYKKDGHKMLHANRLSIKGDTYVKDVEFKNPEGKANGNTWVFITTSQNPQYPYGIVSISNDYKYINGQITDSQSKLSFYSKDM
jgi:hypothetical protein